MFRIRKQCLCFRKALIINPYYYKASIAYCALREWVGGGSSPIEMGKVKRLHANLSVFRGKWWDTTTPISIIYMEGNRKAPMRSKA